MKFIYIDESGMGQEPISVMVGVVADSRRMRKTKEHWNNLLRNLSNKIGRNIKEIHTRDFYSGNSPWRDLDGDQRSDIITVIFNWLTNRKHSIVISAVDKNEFYRFYQNENCANDISTLWCFMAFHLSLSIQKGYQGFPRGRNRTINPSGHTLLIFDDEEREQKHFTDLLLNPPDWSDSYYDKKQKQEKLSQIVDVPHFVDSRNVGLIQLADFICFFLRKYIELQMGYIEPEYDDELEKVTNWGTQILNQLIPINNIYMSCGRCECADLFYKYAPSVLKR